MMTRIIEFIFVQSKNKNEFIQVMYSDGCNEATARDAFHMCEKGDFEKAAQHAHMGGWM